MQAIRRGVIAGLRTPVATTNAALRIGGNQRIPTAAAARVYPLLASEEGKNGLTERRRRNAVLPVLRSEFSTLGRWRQKEDNKPVVEEQKKPEEAGEAPTEGKEGEGPDGKESQDGEKRKEEGEGEQKNKEEPPPPPPPPHGDKSPFTVFMETLQVEFKKSQEWQESTKQLADSANQFTESPAVRRAREGYSKTAEVAGKVGDKTAETLGKTASAVGQGVAWTWNTPVMKAGRTAVKKTGEGVAQVTKPVRETKVYKDVTGNIKEVMDDGSSSRYGGFLEREERKRRRELRESKSERTEKIDEDPKFDSHALFFLKYFFLNFFVFSANSALARA